MYIKGGAHTQCGRATLCAAQAALSLVIFRFLQSKRNYRRAGSPLVSRGKCGKESGRDMFCVVSSYCHCAYSDAICMA